MRRAGDDAGAPWYFPDVSADPRDVAKFHAGHVPRGVWYLSFADERGFLGGLFVRADSLSEALTRSHLLGLNPGGEVQGDELPAAAVAQLPPEFVEKLMDRAALAAFDKRMHS